MLAWCADAGARGDPLRRRHQRRRRGRAAGRRRATPGAVTIDLGALDRVLEVDAVSRAARIQAGALGPGARGPAARARADPAPLPAVVRVLDARRLDRHPRRRPLRDRLHPHRRPGRVGARDHPGGRLGEPPAARARAPGPSPDRHAARLRGHPRRDHRGLGAPPGAPRAQALVRASRSTTSRAGAEAVRELVAVRPQPGQLPPARRDRVGGHRRGAAGQGAPGARLRVRPPPGRRADGPRARGGAATTAASRARSRRSRRAARRTGRTRRGERSDPVGSWRHAFLAAPYLRDTFVASASSRDTFETAITWDRFAGFHATVMEAARAAIAEVCGDAPDGQGRRGSRAASPTSTRTARRPTSRSSRPAGAAARSSSGTRSRPRSRRR